MLSSEKLAIAAHLHVLLRRKTGRVTDTEWMIANVDYAAEVVRFARARAAEDQQPDLADWARKLEQAMVGRAPVPVAPAPVVAMAAAAPANSPENRYVGRLR